MFQAKEAKEKSYEAKMPLKIQDVNIGNIIISKLVETKNNSKYLIGDLHEVIRSLVLILPKSQMSGWIC